MAEPAHSLDMNEECCTDITTYCPHEACTLLLRGKCMETIYLLDRKYHPTYNGTLIQVSWHPIGHPMPDYEEHMRCLLSAHCERMLCQVQDATVPHCDPEIMPHICPETTTPLSTTQMMYSTTPYYNQEASNIPARSAESAQTGIFPQGVVPVRPVFPNNIRLTPVNTGLIRLQYPQFGRYQPPGSAKPVLLPVASNIPQSTARQPDKPAPQPTPQEQPPAVPKQVAQPTQPPPPANPPPEEPNIPPEGNAGEIRSGPQPNDQTANKMKTSNQLNSSATSGVMNMDPGKPPNTIPNMGSSSHNQKPVQPLLETKYQSTTGAFEIPPKEVNIKPEAPNPTVQGSSVRASLPQMPKDNPPKESNKTKNATSTTTQTSTGKNGIGAGRQAGIIINGQQPIFTVNPLGISGVSTGPPEVIMTTGAVGNNPNDWDRYDEKILAGGIVGGALLALLMVCLTVCCVKRRKDKSAASSSSSHRGLHLQYSGFPLDSDMLNDPVYKSSLKSINGPPPIPYRPPAPQISYVNSFREPTNFVGSGGGGVSFGEEQMESNDYEELPCDVDPAAREAYLELVDAPKQPTSRTTSNVSNVSAKRHVKIHSVPTLYDVNRKNVPLVKRHSSACPLKSNSMRNSGRPLPARPTVSTLPRTLESVPKEVYEPIGIMEPHHGYEVPVSVSNTNLAMLGLLNYPQSGSGYETGVLINQGRRHSHIPTTGLMDNNGQLNSPDYFVLERQDDGSPMSTISQGDYLVNGHPDSLTYSVPSEDSYAELGHDYLDLERSIGGWNSSNPHIPHDIHL